MKRRRVAVGFFRERGKTKPITKSAGQHKKIVRHPKQFNNISPGNRVTQIAKSEFNLLKKHSRRIVLAGSIRRRKPNPSDIDFVIIPKNAKAKAAIYEHASKYKIRARGAQLLSYWRLPRKKCQVDIYFAEPEYLGAMIMFATGPGEYNIALRAKAIAQGLKLNQYGVWKDNRRVGKATTEREVYAALMYPYKSPELRGLSDKEAEKRFGVKPGQRVLRGGGKAKRCPKYWCEPYELVVYHDEDFVIIRYPAAKKGKFGFQVIPITKDYKRLDDWEICPEPYSLEIAKQLMERNRERVQAYKRGKV